MSSRGHRVFRGRGLADWWQCWSCNGLFLVESDHPVCERESARGADERAAISARITELRDMAHTRLGGDISMLSSAELDERVALADRIALELRDLEERMEAL